MKHLITAAAIGLPLLLTSGPAALAQDLQNLSGTSEYGFTVRMPAGAVQEKRTAEIPDGTVSTMAWSVLAGGVQYSIAVSDYPESASDALPPARAMLAMMADSVAGQVGGRVADERQIELQGNHPGSAILITDGGEGAIQGRFYVVGSRIYMLMITYDIRQGMGSGGEFLESLRLTGAKASR